MHVTTNRLDYNHLQCKEILEIFKKRTITTGPKALNFVSLLSQEESQWPSSGSVRRCPAVCDLLLLGCVGNLLLSTFGSIIQFSRKLIHSFHHSFQII